MAASGRDGEDPPFLRAMGAAECPTCGEQYWRHPVSVRWDWLHVLCDGTLVKL